MPWTPEQRAAQAARLRALRPWERSTGPRTLEGKARSSQNALKNGMSTTFMRTIMAEVRRQAREDRAQLDRIQHRL